MLQVVIVDLEHNQITITEEIPTVPEPELGYLRSEISRLLYPKVVQIDQLKKSSGNSTVLQFNGSKVWGPEHDIQLR